VDGSVPKQAQKKSDTIWKYFHIFLKPFTQSLSLMVTPTAAPSFNEVELAFWDFGAKALGIWQ
jgi:hypothetical protein